MNKSDVQVVNKDGISVEQLIEFLRLCPPKAKVLLNHCTSIDFEEKDGTIIKHKSWCFDEIIEARKEYVQNAKERYPYYESESNVVWLTHQEE